MALSPANYEIIREAIYEYNFPCVTYNFIHDHEVKHQSMIEVETYIQDCLLSNECDILKDGLSNVLYWGYARTGYRARRVKNFRSKVLVKQLYKTKDLFENLDGPGLVKIKQLSLPEFSGMSFVSKVRMFLDPHNYVILDQKLLKIRETSLKTVLDAVNFSEKETRIRISGPNENAYVKWCHLCRNIVHDYFQNEQVRAVDIERAIFHLIDTKKIECAARIIQEV